MPKVEDYFIPVGSKCVGWIHVSSSRRSRKKSLAFLKRWHWLQMESDSHSRASATSVSGVPVWSSRRSKGNLLRLRARLYFAKGCAVVRLAFDHCSLAGKEEARSCPDLPAKSRWLKELRASREEIKTPRAQSMP